MREEPTYLDAREQFDIGRDRFISPQTVQHAWSGLAQMVDGYINEKIIINSEEYAEDLLRRCHQLYQDLDQEESLLKRVGKTFAYFTLDLGLTITIKTTNKVLNKIEKLVVEEKELHFEENLSSNVYRIKQ